MAEKNGQGTTAVGFVSDAVTQTVGGEQEADEHDERQADCERIEGDVSGLCEISDHAEA